LLLARADSRAANKVVGAKSQKRDSAQLRVEAVEKVPSKFLGEMQKKVTSQNALHSIILYFGKGQVILENIVLTGQKGFLLRLVVCLAENLDRGGFHEEMESSSARGGCGF
jgi:hypothetical protein